MGDNEKLKKLRNQNVYLKPDTTGKKPETEMKKYVHANLELLYEKAYDELGLQQSKRDQLIGLYVTVISLLVSYVIPATGFDMVVKGWIFVAAAVIGFLLTLVIVRYRIYKEVYWLSCQSLTVMMNIEKEALDEERIKAVFMQVMYTKAKSFLRIGKDGQEKFARGSYVLKNLFSAETIYFIIQALCASALFAMGVVIISGLTAGTAVFCGLAVAVIMMALFLAKYFGELIKVYQGLLDMDMFKKAFGKAWFLHMFVSVGQKKTAG